MGTLSVRVDPDIYIYIYRFRRLNCTRVWVRVVLVAKPPPETRVDRERFADQSRKSGPTAARNENADAIDSIEFQSIPKEVRPKSSGLAKKRLTTRRATAAIEHVASDLLKNVSGETTYSLFIRFYFYPQTESIGTTWRHRPERACLYTRSEGRRKVVPRSDISINNTPTIIVTNPFFVFFTSSAPVPTGVNVIIIIIVQRQYVRASAMYGNQMNRKNTVSRVLVVVVGAGQWPPDAFPTGRKVQTNTSSSAIVVRF